MNLTRLDEALTWETVYTPATSISMAGPSFPSSLDIPELMLPVDEFGFFFAGFRTIVPKSPLNSLPKAVLLSTSAPMTYMQNS